MSESEAQTTPYMANRLNSLDQTVAKDIWLDWDTEENDSDGENYGDGTRAPSPLVRIKEEPRSPCASPTPTSSMPVEPTEFCAQVQVKREALSPHSSPAPPFSEQAYPCDDSQATAEEDRITQDLEALLGHGYFPKGGDDIGDTDYCCHYCFAGFSFKEELKVHVQKVHSKSELLRCDVCLQSFKHGNDYAGHMKQHAAEKNLRCDRCLINFRSERKFTEHVLDKHFAGTQYVCEYCDSPFSFKEDLLSHKFKEHTNLQDGYRCDTCSVGFRKKKTLELHVTSVHIPNYKCRVCRTVLESREAFEKHNLQHSRTDTRKFLCHSCGSRFTGITTLTLHGLVCLGRRLVDLLPSGEIDYAEKSNKPEEPTKTVEKPNQSEKEVAKPPEQVLLHPPNLTKVIFDGEKLVKIHVPDSHVPLSEMLIGDLVPPESTEPGQVISLTPEELSGRRVNIELCALSEKNGLDASNSPPSEDADNLACESGQAEESSDEETDDPLVSSSTASAEKSISQSFPKNGSSKKVISVLSSTHLSSHQNDELSDTGATENFNHVNANNGPCFESDVTNQIPLNKPEDVSGGCDSSVSEKTGAAVNISTGETTNAVHPDESNGSPDSSNESVSNNKGVNKTSANLSKTSAVDNSKCTSFKTRSKDASKSSACEEASSALDAESEETMSIAEIMETVENASLSVRPARKRGSEEPIERIDNVYKMEDLPERCLKSMKARKLPRLIKKPRMLSDNINQALTFRISKATGHFECKICKAEFVFKYDLTKHERTHQAALKCDKCPASFMKKEDLAAHTLETHFRRVGPRVNSSPSLFANLLSGRLAAKGSMLGIPPGAPPGVTSDQIFTCPNCDANFGFEAELTHHMKIHGDDFKCNACKASFREKSELAKHMLAIHF